MTMRHSILTIIIGSLALGVSQAQASNGDPARGHAFARQYCSKCHSVEAHKLKSPVAEAPPFATFSRYWPLEDIEEALAEGIMVGHNKYPMPVFQLGPDEIADLISYLRTIQEPAVATGPASDRNSGGKASGGHP